jgi:hypothetical protein
METKAKATTRKAKGKPKPVKPVVDRGSESPVEAITPLPKLTDKQRIFVEAYLTCWNATEAARQAGYADPELAGWENRQKQVIQDEISRRIAEKTMSADEVLIRLGDQARGSLKPFLKPSVGGELWPDLTTDEAQANLHLLKKIKPKKRQGGPEEDPWIETEIELEIHDPQAALVHIGRHHKLFTDKSEVTGKNGGPIQTEDIGLTDEQRAARITALLERGRARRT